MRFWSVTAAEIIFEDTMKKIIKTLFTAAVLTASLTLPGAGNLDDLRGLELSHAKLPIYNKDLLQLMVFCDRAERQGRVAIGSNVTLDIIRRNADVDAIRDGWGIKLYPLRDTQLPEILEFWMPRLYSEGVMFTSRADVDQEARVAVGQEAVFFRSPVLDLDGVGFEADFNKRTVTVKDDVRIILRFGESDPRKLFAKERKKLPDKYEFLYATCDSLQIDMLNNRILLIGNVTIDEERSTINSDLMTIFLDRKDDEAIRRDNAAGKVQDVQETLEGVSRIVFDGNVIVKRKLTADEAKDGEQKALADHMTYDVPTGMITLSGSGKNPSIVRGKESIVGRNIVLYRNEQRAFVRGDSRVRVIQPARDGEPERLLTIDSNEARMDYTGNRGEFVGKVTVDDPRMNLQCERMLIGLKETPGGNAAQPSEELTSGLTGFADFSQAGNQRELDTIQCDGGVRVTRRDENGQLLPGEQALSQQAVFDYAARKITMSGGTPTLKRERESLTGKELDIYVNDERLAVRGDSKIILAAPGETGNTIILSDASDLDSGANKLTFTGNVRLNDPRMNLDCERMEIYLMADPAAAKEATAQSAARTSVDPLNFGAESSGKTVEKVICYGNVHMRDELRGDLRTDQLTLLFKPVPPGTPEEPGMFQSNGTRLTRVLCDGNFELVNKPDAASDQQAAARAEKATDAPLAGMLGGGNSSGNRILKADHGILDLEKNQSEFHGSVDVRDDLSSLTCDDMFIYTAKSAPGVQSAAPAPSAAVEEDPDADPFASAELKPDMVPSRIMLTDGVDLERILCTGNVHVSRKDDAGKLQEAFGDRAEYIVANKEVVLTGTPEERPRMTAEGGTMRGDRVVLNTATGEMNVFGNTQLDRDGNAKLPMN